MTMRKPASIKLSTITICEYAIDGLKTEYALNYEQCTEEDHKFYEHAIKYLEKQVRMIKRAQETEFDGLP